MYFQFSQHKHAVDKFRSDVFGFFSLQKREYFPHSVTYYYSAGNIELNGASEACYLTLGSVLAKRLKLKFLL